MIRSQLAIVVAALGLTLAGTAMAQDTSAGLRVGAAKIDITPPADAGVPMNAYDHEKLYLRAIVMDNGSTKGVLIGADLGGINEEVWADASQRISTDLKIPVANIIMTSVHTHSDWPANATTAVGQPRYGSDFVADRSIEAVREAMSKLAPAKVGYGKGEAYLNVNRDTIDDKTKLWTQAANTGAPSDKAVSVLSFIGEDGQPIAAYASYAMHPVNGYLAGFVSGDFAEATTSWVEKAFGGGMVTIFSQAPSGDQNPRWLRTGTNALASKSGVKINGYEMTREPVEAPLRNKKVEDGPLDPAVGRQLGDYMQALGIILGEEVIRTMSRTENFDGTPELWGKQATITCLGRKRLDNAREGVAGQFEDGPDIDIRLGVLGIGDVAIATTNAEIYTRIGQKAIERSPMANTMYVTLANGRANSGYILDDESYGHQTFQALGTKIKAGCAEEGISKGVATLIADYMNH